MSGDPEGARRASRRAAKIAIDVFLLSLAILVVLGISRGLSTVAPGLSAALRLLLHPLTLVAIAVGCLLLRVRTTRPNSASLRPPRRSS